MSELTAQQMIDFGLGRLLIEKKPPSLQRSSSNTELRLKRKHEVPQNWILAHKIYHENRKSEKKNLVTVYDACFLAGIRQRNTINACVSWIKRY